MSIEPNFNSTQGALRLDNIPHICASAAKFAHSPLVEFLMTIPPRGIGRPREPRKLMLSGNCLGADEISASKIPNSAAVPSCAGRDAEFKRGLVPHDAALESPLAAVDNFGSKLVANNSFSTGFSGLSGQ